MVPQLFYSLNNDKQAVVISAAQTQISKFMLYTAADSFFSEVFSL